MSTCRIAVYYKAPSKATKQINVRFDYTKNSLEGQAYAAPDSVEAWEVLQKYAGPLTPFDIRLGVEMAPSDPDRWKGADMLNHYGCLMPLLEFGVPVMFGEVITIEVENPPILEFPTISQEE